MRPVSHIAVLTRDPVLEQALRFIIEGSLPQAKLISLTSLEKGHLAVSAEVLVVDTDNLQEEDLWQLRFLMHARSAPALVLLLGIGFDAAKFADLLGGAKVVLQKPFENRLFLSALKNILESDVLTQ